MTDFLLLKPMKDAVIRVADAGVPAEIISKVLLMMSSEIAVVYGVERKQWESQCKDVYSESVKNYSVELFSNKNPIQE